MLQLFWFSSIMAVLGTILYYFANKKQNQKIKKFLEQQRFKEWTTKRIYVDEESGNNEFFIDPFTKEKVYYDELRFFDEKHQPPAHIETVWDTRTEILKRTRIAYVGRKKCYKLVDLP